MTEMEKMGKKAKIAARTLATAGAKKNEALEAIAAALQANAAKIIAANATDLENGKNNGLSAALLDRLMLNESRIDGIAQGVREVEALPDPIGTVISGSTRPNGLKITKVRVPLGVIGIIFATGLSVVWNNLNIQIGTGFDYTAGTGETNINSGFYNS